MLKAKGLFGARNYHYQANGNLVKDFTVLGARVYQALARMRIPTVMMRVITTHLCTARIRSCPVHWKPCSAKNWGTVETGNRGIPITIQRSAGSVPIWKRT